jgi:excisionase family DNA binding protein
MTHGMETTSTIKERATSSELLTVEEAAKVLRSSTYTVRRMLRAGTIRGVKLGNQWRINRSALRSRVGLN